MNDTRLSSEPPSDSRRPPTAAVPPTLAALPRRYLIDAHARRAATAPDSPPRLRITGRDTDTGQAVFIKLSNDGEATRREADILTRIQNPGLARLLDWGMHAAGGYLVLELVPGATLERRLRDDGPVRSTRQVRPLLSGLAEATAAIHHAGILHRDLKPANIVVRPDGSTVIIDFGAACAVSFAGGGGHSEDFATDGYAAPEQYQKGGVEGPWTDIYALAAIAYRIVTGAPPPPAPVRQGADGEGLPALDRIAAADPSLAEALAWGLSVDPGTRPRTIEDWHAALVSPAGAAGESGLADMALPPLEPDPAVMIRDDGVSDIVDGPPTLPIRRVGAGPNSDAAQASLLTAAAAPAASRSRRQLRFLAMLAVIGLIVPAIGWLVGPSYRRQVLKQWTVNPAGEGDVRHISEAIAHAPDGSRILIDAGTYVESLVVDRPLTLEASDPAAPPVVSPSTGPCLVIGGDRAEVHGLVMRGADETNSGTTTTPAPATLGTPADPSACVVVVSGSPVVADNRITAAAGPAVDVEDGSTPMITGNTVTQTPSPSIHIANGARPTIEGNTISGSGSVLITAGGGGTLRGNRILDAKASAIQVAAGAAPVITGNTIERPSEAGIFIYDEGKGHISGNDIVDAKLSGIVVDEGAPEIIGNTITRSGEHGILILAADGARVADNVVEASKGHAIVVSADSVVELTGNRTQGNRAPEYVDLRRR